MPLHIPCVQGEGYWHSLRYGIVTATGVENIITPAKAVPVKGERRERYMRTLLCELILGRAVETAVTPTMIHGNESEDNARAAFAFQTGVDPLPAGFVVSDDRTIGCSPDNFLGGDDGLLEIKCPFSPVVHLGYMLDPASLQAEYWQQCQTQLFVTGRKWCKLIAHNIAMPEMVQVVIEPDLEWQEKLSEALAAFNADFAALKARAVEAGWLKDTHYDDRIEAQPRAYPEFISDADIDAILQNAGVR
jgi:hypothetical protein